MFKLQFNNKTHQLIDLQQEVNAQVHQGLDMAILISKKLIISIKLISSKHQMKINILNSKYSRHHKLQN